MDADACGDMEQKVFLCIKTFYWNIKLTYAYQALSFIYFAISSVLLFYFIFLLYSFIDTFNVIHLKIE